MHTLSLGSLGPLGGLVKNTDHQTENKYQFWTGRLPSGFGRGILALESRVRVTMDGADAFPPYSLLKLVSTQNSIGAVVL